MPLPSFLGPFIKVPAASGVQSAADLPARAGGEPHVLPFVMQVQLQTKWCWAATAASVSAFYADDPVWTQCQIASKCLDMECCITPLPPPPQNWPGNRMYALDVALNKIIHHLAEGGPIGGALTFSSIMSEINSGRPICCHISWEHFNVIVGYYDNSDQDIVVRDPLLGEKTLPYAMLVSNYHGGAWDDSYLTI